MASLAAVRAHDAAGHVGHHLADLSEVYLGDEELLAFARRDGRVPGDDGHAAVECGLGGRGELVASVVGDHDGVDALGGGIGHDFDLTGHAVLRGGPEEFQFLWVLQLGVRFLRAGVRLVEDHDAEELGHQDHLDRLAWLGLDDVAAGCSSFRSGLSSSIGWRLGASAGAASVGAAASAGASAGAAGAGAAAGAQAASSRPAMTSTLKAVIRNLVHGNPPGWVKIGW